MARPPRPAARGRSMRRRRETHFSLDSMFFRGLVPDANELDRNHQAKRAPSHGRSHYNESQRSGQRGNPVLRDGGNLIGHGSSHFSPVMEFLGDTKTLEEARIDGLGGKFGLVVGALHGVVR